MAKLLNYKFEIFPTRPQRLQLNQILKQSRIQWNKAVTIRRKLRRSLFSGQVEYVLTTCLSLQKKNWQSNRKKAVEKFQKDRAEISALEYESAAKLYDIKNLLGKSLEVDRKHLDSRILAEEVNAIYNSELDEWKKAKAAGVEIKKLPKRPLFWQMMHAINNYAGFEAKAYVDKSFKSPKGSALSDVRFNVSGCAESIRWNQAVNPKKGQRRASPTGSNKMTALA
jgi:hypothetical protein